MNITLLKLEDYPAAIAQKATELEVLKRKSEKLQIAIKRFETIAKGVVTGPNAEQRAKACLEKLDESTGYQTLLTEFDAVDSERSTAEIQLQQLRDEFAVLKLQVRLEIARSFSEE